MSRRWPFLFLLVVLTALFAWEAYKGEVGREYGAPVAREERPGLYYLLYGRPVDRPAGRLGPPAPLGLVATPEPRPTPAGPPRGPRPMTPPDPNRRRSSSATWRFV
jgi:hypothetical protein